MLSISLIPFDIIGAIKLFLMLFLILSIVLFKTLFILFVIIPEILSGCFIASVTTLDNSSWIKLLISLFTLSVTTVFI